MVDPRLVRVLRLPQTSEDRYHLSLTCWHWTAAAVPKGHGPSWFLSISRVRRRVMSGAKHFNFHLLRSSIFALSAKPLILSPQYFVQRWSSNPRFVYICHLDLGKWLISRYSAYYPLACCADIWLCVLRGSISINVCSSWSSSFSRKACSRTLF